ncbi:MAG: RlmE family RNA methyltransferase [Chloroflexota bacterium]
MPKGWRKQQSQDQYFRRAKSEGYRARSAYKLLQINEKYRILRPGTSVLDLGAAPGSWSQVARKVCGPNSRVVAVDLQPIQPLPGVQTLQCDIGEPACQEQMKAALPAGADVVLSDVSPRISGIAITDHARSLDLAAASLQVARQLLHKGGAFVVKVFQGEGFAGFVEECKGRFERVHVFSPQASREESNERYVVCLRAREGGQS